MSTSSSAPRRRENRRATDKQPSQPSRWAQTKQAFQLTRRNDPKLVPYMLGFFVLSVLLFLAIGLLVHNWITFLILGVLVGLLAAMWTLSFRGRRAALAELDGQPGSSRAAMSLLSRGWIMPEEPVAGNRQRDLVFRAIGRPGVVLVTEGPATRVKPLVDAEKRQLRRILPEVPIHVIQTGNGEGQVSIKDLASTMRKLPAGITKEEVYVVDKRLASMRAAALPIPKGIDPNRMRPSRRAMRGR